MANFPHWINKKSTTTNTSNLSPRQVANKAYSLAIKKLDRDDKRRRPHYTVRERLLLSNTMTKAEDMLNKRTPRSNRRVLASEFDGDVNMGPAATNIPPPAPILPERVQELIGSVVQPEQVHEFTAPIQAEQVHKPIAPIQLHQVQELAVPAPIQLPQVQEPTAPAPIPLPQLQVPSAPAPIQSHQVQESTNTTANTISFTPIATTLTTTATNAVAAAPPSSLPSAEQIAVSLAVVAAVAYNTLVVAATVNENQQKAASFCRPIMIPSHSMTSFKTII